MGGRVSEREEKVSESVSLLRSLFSWEDQHFETGWLAIWIFSIRAILTRSFSGRSSMFCQKVRICYSMREEGRV